MDFEVMSDKLITVIDEILDNEILVKYIGHDSNEPLDATINPKDISPVGSDMRVFPYPFGSKYNDKARSQVHVYYPAFVFKNNNYVSEMVLNFDILVHKDIWLMTDNGKRVVRPYQILNYILKTFRDRNINNLGRLQFGEGSHVVTNEEYEGVRVSASFVEWG